jgi:hypothetical protein
MEYGFYISLATLAALIAHAIRATWHIRGMETEIRSDMDAQIDNLQRDITKLEKSSMERAETLRHEFGETGSALRTKIHEVETWNRDTFVRKESFEMVIGRIEKTFEKSVEKLEKSIEKLGDRFEEASRHD